MVETRAERSNDASGEHDGAQVFDTRKTDRGFSYANYEPAAGFQHVVCGPRDQSAGRTTGDFGDRLHRGRNDDHSIDEEARAGKRSRHVVIVVGHLRQIFQLGEGGVGFGPHNRIGPPAHDQMGLDLALGERPQKLDSVLGA